MSLLSWTKQGMYVQEAKGQLSDMGLYKLLTKDSMAQYQEEIDELLKCLPWEIQERIIASLPWRQLLLITEDPHTWQPRMPHCVWHYTIMKGISGCIYSSLFPCATGAATYLKHARDFLQKLGYIDELPGNTILATMEVTPLYTDIPHKDGKNKAIKNIMPDKDTASVSVILSSFVLTTTSGMGTPYT